MSKKIKTKVHPLFKYHPIRFSEARKSFIDEAAKTLLDDFGLGIKAVFCNDSIKLKNSLDIYLKGRQEHITTSVSFDIYPG